MSTVMQHGMDLYYATLQCYPSPSLSSHHGSAPLQPNEKDMAWRREAQSTSKGRLHQFNAFTVATTHGPRQVDWWPGLWRGCMAPRKSVATSDVLWAMLWCEGHTLCFLEARVCNLWCWHPSNHSIQLDRPCVVFVLLLSLSNSELWQMGNASLC